jgi:hypothetical protein
MESVIKAVASGGGGDGVKTHNKKAAAAVRGVMAVPGPILTASWAGEVDAILCPFLPGEQYGNAITDLIFGDIAPQAKVRTKQLSLTPFSKLMLKHIVIPRHRLGFGTSIGRALKVGAAGCFLARSSL